MRRQAFVFALSSSFFLLSTAIIAAQKTVTAKVQSVDAANKVIRIDDLELEVTRKSKISIDGKKGSLADIKAGQSAKIVYDDSLEAVISIAVGAIADEATAEVVNISELKTLKNYTSHSLSSDALRIYWDGPEGQIWTAQRKSADSRFSNQTNLEITGRHPTVSSDELELIFVSKRSDGKKGEALHSANRSRKEDEFRRPTEISELVDKAGKSNLKNPFLSPDGLTLYFNTYREGQPPTVDYATRESNQEKWSKPKMLPLSKKADLTWPFVSDDGCTMLAFEAGQARLSVWRRDSIDDVFLREQIVSDSHGEMIAGRCPRFVVATNELFFVSNVGGEGGTRMSCITNFSSLAPSFLKAD